MCIKCGQVEYQADHIFEKAQNYVISMWKNRCSQVLIHRLSGIALLFYPQSFIIYS